MERNSAVNDTPPRIIRHELSLRSVWSVIAIVVSLWLVVRIWPVILLLLIALVLAGTLSPLLGWLERHHVPQTVGLSLVLLTGIGTIVGVGALVIPALLTQGSDLVASIPGIQRHLADYLAHLPAFAQSADAIRSARAEQLVEPLGDMLPQMRTN
jgi:predicted PurR-regulated permease PerM